MALVFLLQLAAVVSTALFAGAALFISVVIHWCILGIKDHRTALAFFADFYKRSALFQAPLALLSGLSSLVLLLWPGLENAALPPHALLGAVAFAAVTLAWTKLAMMPLNGKLIKWGTDPGATVDPKLARGMLNEWAVRHALRTALSCASFLAFAVAGLRRQG